MSAPGPLNPNGFVCDVPGHADRIFYRGRYYGLARIEAQDVRIAELERKLRVAEPSMSEGMSARRAGHVESAFQVVFDGYNSPRGSRGDLDYIVFLRDRLTKAFGILQRATGRAAWASDNCPIEPSMPNEITITLGVDTGPARASIAAPAEDLRKAVDALAAVGGVR